MNLAPPMIALETEVHPAFLAYLIPSTSALLSNAPIPKTLWYL